jgi:hypothetical protein
MIHCPMMCADGAARSTPWVACSPMISNPTENHRQKISQKNWLLRKRERGKKKKTKGQNLNEKIVKIIFAGYVAKWLLNFTF